MTESASALSAWESFYVIVGSSGGALIGLQFVVITLIADRRELAPAPTVHAFGTPTVVHLTGALVASAVMSAPWSSLVPLAVVLWICGVCGLAYTTIAIRRARRQTFYQPVFEDWVWHGALPLVSYFVLTVAAALLCAHPDGAVYGIGSAALGLLLIGIHNAWDTVTHVVFTGSSDTAAKPD